MVRSVLTLGVATLACAAALAEEPGWEHVEYDCFDGTKVSVAMRDDRDLIVLTIDGEEYELPHVEAASGAKYSDGAVTFWAKGGGAIVEVDGAVIQGGCVLVSSGAGDEAATATHQGDAAGAGSVGVGAVAGSTTASEGALSSLAVISSAEVDVTAFNTGLDGAVLVGETWPADPVLIVLRFLEYYNVGGLSLVKRDEAGESAPATTITVIREGLLDDSVRAIWDEIRLRRTGDGTWRIAGARRAYRCWRGAETVSYAAELCP
jgi:membrane-bound inhibitor of C-type lysozyme